MATSSKYSMGQLRYQKNFSYKTDLKFNESKYVNIPISEDSSNYYQDVYFKTTDTSVFSNFEQGVPYYIKISIPENMFYDCSYNLKLIDTPTVGQGQDFPIINPNKNFQLLRQINVYRSEVVKNIDDLLKTNIIFFPIQSNKPYNGSWNIERNENCPYTVKVAIIGEDNVSTNGEDYFYRGYQINNKRIIQLEHSWNSMFTNNYITKNFIYTPRYTDTNLSCILLETIRDKFDLDIKNNDNTYGRKINKDNVNIEVYKLSDLLSAADNNAPLKDRSPLVNIGLYSHPGLMFAINGEQIQVGQTGFYELNNFEINSLAIAVAEETGENTESTINSDLDYFTLDYQYKVS